MASIVVMEDDGVVRGLVLRVLEMKGHEVRAFEDAKPTLVSVDFGAVEVVVTDLKMPTRVEEAIAGQRAKRKRHVWCGLYRARHDSVARKLGACPGRVTGRVPPPGTSLLRSFLWFCWADTGIPSTDANMA